jgi:predicted ATP-binding protein involved in virulence
MGLIFANRPPPSAMRIDQLHVKNFKGFEDQMFLFPRSLDAPAGNGSFHLIIGLNGKGKTSALDALAVAASCWFLGVPGGNRRSITRSDIRIKLNVFEDTLRLEEQYPVSVEAEGVVQGVADQWKRSNTGGSTNWLEVKTVKEAAEAAVSNARNGDRVTLPLISYYGAGRLWLEPNQPAVQAEADRNEKAPQDVRGDDDDDDDAEFNSRLAGYRYSIDPRCNAGQLLRWLKLEQKIAFATGGESKQFKIVKEAIRSGVEGCQSVQYHPQLGLILDIEGQSKLPFNTLSDGQRNMIAMMGDLAFKAAQLNPHLGEDVLKLTPGIVLIDELDLHLHPVWQRHVTEDLRRTFPELQFIATTHSPFLVQSMREGELICLDQEAISQTGNLGPEEIARGLMGVQRPEVSLRYAEMKAVARGYLETLEEAALSPEDKLAEYQQRLAESIAPYADNPAFQAFLEMERAAVRRGPNRDNTRSDYSKVAS